MISRKHRGSQKNSVINLRLVQNHHTKRHDPNGWYDVPIGKPEGIRSIGPVKHKKSFRHVSFKGKKMELVIEKNESLLTLHYVKYPIL